MKKGDLIQWVAKDDWWLDDCPLRLNSQYRVQEIQNFNGQIGILINNWWIHDGYMQIFPPFQFLTPGRRVRIALRVNEEEGWQNVWVDRMDAYIGKIFTIRAFDHGGVKFKEDQEYWFPYSCLEPV